MKKISKKILLSTLILGIIAITPISADPGDQDDPIIVLSYLNQRFNELIGDYKLDKIEEHEQTIVSLNEKIDELTSKVDAQNQSGSVLEIVTLAPNQTLVCGAGTELILRSGNATAVASASGGLADVTGGVDIAQGEYILPNHLLIIPRDDGRGVYSSEGAIFMVRGAYTITPEVIE